MVSVTSASRYLTSASRYHPRYQRRSLMYIRGLIPRNFAVLAEVVPIRSAYDSEIEATNSDFWHLLIIYANSLAQDQDRKNVGPDLDPSRYRH